MTGEDALRKRCQERPLDCMEQGIDKALAEMELMRTEIKQLRRLVKLQNKKIAELTPTTPQ